ncbi:MAG: AraC family transcriptional regulator [Chitinophagaceae bacterium]|jgi:AraC-like DNA-binding protein|nr:AraC family transcriptional regulator [Chitinophagaceae bacterium]
MSSGLFISSASVKRLIRNTLINEPEIFSPGHLETILSRYFDIPFTELDRDFTNTEGYSISQFVAECRIDKAKELIVYSSECLPEIASKLGFASEAILGDTILQQTGLHIQHYLGIRNERQQNTYILKITARR